MPLLSLETGESPLASVMVYVLGIILCLIIHAFTTATQYALGQFRSETSHNLGAEKLKENKVISLLFSKSSDFVTSFKFTKMLTLVTLSFCTYFAVLSMEFEAFPKVASWMLVIMVLMITGVCFVFAEAIPRVLGGHFPVKMLKSTYWIPILFHFLLIPVRSPFTWLQDKLSNWLQVPDEDREIDQTDIEILIRSLGEHDNTVAESIRKIISKSLQLDELVVQDILLPRSQVRYLDVYDSISENLEFSKKCGHTRYPLCEKDLDNCLGIVHIKDLYRFKGDLNSIDLKKVMRKFTTFGLEDPLINALERMLNMKMHMALVQDEFGGTVGVVTLEQILEELVGDIQDEFDIEEDPIKKLGHQKFRVLGLTPIHDLEEILEIEFENEEISTFGGLVTTELGRIPEVGESVVIEGLDIVVKEVEDKRIVACEVVILEKEEGL